MKWISREGKDMFNLQANAASIAKGIREDLDMQLMNDGIRITGFQVMSFNYPKEIQDMITKTASHEMIGNLAKYQQVSMTDGSLQARSKAGGAAADMAGMMMGMQLAKEMMQNMNPTCAANRNEGTRQRSSCFRQRRSQPNFVQIATGKTKAPIFVHQCVTSSSSNPVPDPCNRNGSGQHDISASILTLDEAPY